MKKTLSFTLAAALAAGGFAASLALGSTARTVTVKSAFVTGLKKNALVTSAGLTLYRNTTEKSGRIRCTGACATAWPPLLVPVGATLTAGSGVAKAKLGTVKRPDGKRQATYGGSPLYRFAADRKAGPANAQGLGGIWFAAGAPAAVAPATTAPAATTAPPPTDTGYGGGYG
jgi:predicted lipoprotein with Yx(FWY)xxD motif